MEDAERVRAVCYATPTTIECTGTWSLVNNSASSMKCLSRLEVVNRRLKLLAIILGEVCGLHVKVMPSFSSV